MPETDRVSGPLITTDICLLRSQNIINNLSDLKGDVDSNKKLNDKLAKIIIGNGDVGLVEKVNILYHKNQLIGEVFSIIKSIFVTLITLWAVGVLHL